jgi:hypothetical protein
MPPVDPTDERRHQPDDTPLWNESYYLDWFTPDGAAGGYVRLGFVPNIGQVWYWACLVRPGQPLVTVIEHGLDTPRDSQSLEVRGPGVWADHSVGEPLELMSCDLESFGLSLAAADVYGSLRGDQVPFGFELDWYTDRGAYMWPEGSVPRYEIPCRVQGRVMVGDERFEVDGWGQRDHSWGAARDWWAQEWCWSAGRLEDGTRWHTAGAFYDGLDLAFGYILPADSDQFVDVTAKVVEAPRGEHGFVNEARLQFGDLDLRCTALAWSPVLLTHPDGRLDRFPRAMCEVQAADGRRGHGWIEFNQPQR